ncbi:EamA/RhaT family transporter [Psychromonas sp. psych-6C06]|uniref:DMT family transporter n=1 Tax=Psychromonas sp. psych-6C06 TaxID=2058089 RepID=UPI000C324830|nr:DMT family transporter [Psychromonas sp. psych-6C06]PKF61738.1 EamA/RhaT family transporter [Psychromonas sp. psych-6C06]
MYIGMLLALFGTLLFSLKSIFIKFAYAQGLDANTVLVFRMAISVPFYLVILSYLMIKRKQQSYAVPLSSMLLLKVLGLGFLGYYLSSLLDLMGLEYISAQLERLTLFTYPFMVAIIGYFLFKQPLSKRLLLSLLISYLGLWVVMGQELQITGNNVVLGTVLVMGAALSFSFYVLLSKSLINQIGSLLFTSLAMTASSVLVFIHGAIEIDFLALVITPQAWLWLFLLAILSTVLPSFMMSEAIQRIGPTQTGIMGTLGPIFTIVLAIYLLDEPITLYMFFGMMMVMCGVAVLMIKKK